MAIVHRYALIRGNIVNWLFFSHCKVSCRGSVPFSTELTEILEGRIVAVSQFLFEKCMSLYIIIYIFMFNRTKVKENAHFDCHSFIFKWVV